MKTFGIVALAVLIALAIQNFILSQNKPVIRKTESAYERVMRTGILRCAYGVWEPCVMRDPNTGQISGIVYDIMQEVGKSLNLKIEYSLEVPWDSIGIALQTGKVDAHCAGVFATPARGRIMAFSNPLFYSKALAFARADDKRFDFNLDRINRADITVALSDDDITTEIYRNDFPQAKKYELAQFCPFEELFLAVATKKADVTFNGPTRLQTFERTYPGKIKIIPTAMPLRIYANAVAVDIKEAELLQMLNTAINQMIENGKVDKLVAKYRAKYNMDFLIPVKNSYNLK
jgi:polar amino acid transport system substrate-binding protein